MRTIIKNNSNTCHNNKINKHTAHKLLKSHRCNMSTIQRNIMKLMSSPGYHQNVSVETHGPRCIM